MAPCLYLDAVTPNSLVLKSSSIPVIEGKNHQTVGTWGPRLTMQAVPLSGLLVWSISLMTLEIQEAKRAKLPKMKGHSTPRKPMIDGKCPYS